MDVPLSQMFFVNKVYFCSLAFRVGNIVMPGNGSNMPQGQVSDITDDVRRLMAWVRFMGS